jgi:CubicO group peptidase (beta-lactamase class C family)
MVLSKAWGLADLERHVPYTPETITEAGSITKQITAAATLLLEQQVKISLEDDVRKYLPEFPNYGHVIKLKYLLHHTSGIREWSDLEAITGWPRTTKAYNNEDVFNMLCRQKGLNNLPGTEYIYSNSNYLLLCMIIEKVSGMTLPEFTKKYIFEPAGMTHTS